MEFNLSTDIEKSIPKAIVFNFEELKGELLDAITPYKALIVTEENIKDAKKQRASLNKFESAINDKKKEVKKAYMSPYTEFENQCKELMDIVNSASKHIDEQVKAIEEAKKEPEKTKDIKIKFYATTEKFRKDMKKLCIKHDIYYEGAK